MVAFYLVESCTRKIPAADSKTPEALNYSQGGALIVDIALAAIAIGIAICVALQARGMVDFGIFASRLGTITPLAAKVMFATGAGVIALDLSKVLFQLVKHENAMNRLVARKQAEIDAQAAPAEAAAADLPLPPPPQVPDEVVTAADLRIAQLEGELAAARAHIADLERPDEGDAAGAPAAPPPPPPPATPDPELERLRGELAAAQAKIARLEAAARRPTTPPPAAAAAAASASAAAEPVSIEDHVKGMDPTVRAKLLFALQDYFNEMLKELAPEPEGNPLAIAIVRQALERRRSGIMSGGAGRDVPFTPDKRISRGLTRSVSQTADSLASGLAHSSWGDSDDEEIDEDDLAAEVRRELRNLFAANQPLMEFCKPIEASYDSKDADEVKRQIINAAKDLVGALIARYECNRDEAFDLTGIAKRDSEGSERE